MSSKPNTSQNSTKLSPTVARRIAQARLAAPIPRSTFYRLIDDGRIDSIRIGSRILIPAEALDQFLKRCYNGERF